MQSREAGRRRVRARRQRRGSILDSLLFVGALGLAAGFLLRSTVFPNARRAARAEARVARQEAAVHATASRVAQLRAEITALQSDPLYIQRVLRRRARRVMPQRFEVAKAAPPPPDSQ